MLEGFSKWVGIRGEGGYESRVMEKITFAMLESENINYGRHRIQ